jgi:MFS family permease
MNFALKFLRSLNALFLLAAVLSLGYGAVFALLAEIRGAYGFSNSAMGFIGGSAFAAGFVSQVWLSRFADHGHGTILIRVGLAMAFSGVLLMAFADTLFLWLLSRALLGFGGGCIMPAIRRLALASDPARAGENIGRMAAFEMTGFLVGPMLASILNLWWGLSAPFFAFACFLALLTPIVIWADVPGAANPQRGGAIKTLLVKPAMQASIATGISFYITVGVFEGIWALFMADLGASQLFIGITLSVFTLPMIFVAPFAGSLAQRKGPLLVSAVTVSVAIACMLTYGVVQNLWLLCIPLAIHAVADAYTMPANQMAVGRASGQDLLATGQGLYGATGLAVAGLAAISGGMMYEAWGAFGLWWVSATVMIGFLSFAWWRGDELRKPDLSVFAPHPSGGTSI